MHASPRRAAAARWMRKYKQGIDDTAISQGFMKIGVDRSSEVDARVVRAAAMTHKATGLQSPCPRPGNGVAALEEIDIVERDGVPLMVPYRFLAPTKPMARCTGKGAARQPWVEFDEHRRKHDGRSFALVLAMRAAGRLDRVLVSHDAGWSPLGSLTAASSPSTFLSPTFVPALKAAGLSQGRRPVAGGEPAAGVGARR